MDTINQTLASAEAEEWIPVELALVDRMWLPDTEILRLKGFHSLSVLGRLQVNPLWYLSITFQNSYDIIFENNRINIIIHTLNIIIRDFG